MPKGHVGQEDGDFRRVLVLVIYFDHTLFGELLRETRNLENVPREIFRKGKS